MKNIFYQFKIFVTFFLFFSFVGNIQATKIPDFSELASELIPSVVSVSVMISRDLSPPNRPVPPQFPPGSPFEDFFKDFSKGEAFLEHLLLDREEVRLLLDLVL